MIKLRVADILKEKGLSRYWLWKHTDMSNQNFNKMLNNETKSIKYKYIALFCEVLGCNISDLFEFISDV